MGLDMYGFSKPRRTNGQVVLEAEPEELAYWRKHNALHTWMEARWQEMTREKYQEITGLKITKKAFNELHDSVFNCVDMPLDLEMLNRLTGDILEKRLQPASGFFWGSTDYDPAEEAAKDLAFIRDAREAIQNGQCVYYSSWW